MAPKTSKKSAAVAAKPKQTDVRYFQIHEGDPFDEKLMTGWIRQASDLPGEACF